jgi:hypothetical protein
VRIDPRLIEQSKRQAAARAAYDEHIKQFAFPVQWSLLNARERKEWYNGFVS